jgi:hypothetical protein
VVKDLRAQLAHERAVKAQLLQALKGVAIVLNCGGVMRTFDGEPWIGAVRDAIELAERPLT